MLKFNPIQLGKSIVIQRKVSMEDTSLNYGSGKIEKLLATPKLLALMIEAGAMLVDEELPEDFISIGKHSEIDHYKPTLLGSTVSVEVKVVASDEEKVTLQMEAFDEVGKIGEGKHTRFIVNQQQLLIRANEREAKIQEVGV